MAPKRPSYWRTKTIRLERQLERDSRGYFLFGVLVGLSVGTSIMAILLVAMP